ncbi:hypothetical protein LCGC14_0392240 [marine sediment metagenome]|uniref:PD-(D/E)XK endonuclease-like domain-containing protein n=1 Tax=marine sediment metagenome TaxID=412755 RepID=A0A0F9SZE2_9ZZZZ
MKIKRRRKHSYAYSPYTDGLTQSALGLWLQCREQFRLKYVEGWSAKGNPLPLHYGSASHHVLRRMYERKLTIKKSIAEFDKLWRKERQTTFIPQKLLAQHDLVLGMLDSIMPHYLRRIQKKDKPFNDFKTKKWLALEHKFKIPFDVESNQAVLRGMFDGVFLDDKGRLWLFETKNLSRIDQNDIQASLPFDLQVMFYLYALVRTYPEHKIGGVLYNVLRRPGLRQGVKETLSDFIKRIEKDVSKKYAHYFMRFPMPITRSEILEWSDKTLWPMISNLLEWWQGLDDSTPRHYMNPHALVGKYGRCEMFNAIVDNNFNGLYRRDVVFSELEA